MTKHQSTDATYTASELLCVMAARLLKDGQIVFAGIGVPLLAATLAQHQFAPHLTILFEGGTIGPRIVPGELPPSTNEQRCTRYANMVLPITDVLLLLQRGYVDVGYFITGETRGYKGGKFDRVKVLKPFGKGGWGSLGVNLRYDYLDLKDRSASIFGGKQNAFQASLNWKPIDYVLFGLNYAHIKYDDAAIDADPGPGVDRNYIVDMVAARAQVDF